MVSSSSDFSPTDFTVDQLAHDAGLPVSTVRMYQQRGLIDPPEKRGRVGYYGDAHRERLRLIAQLQDRGFSLAAIKEAVDSWDSGKSLDQLLGIGANTPTLAATPLRLTLAELATKFEGLELTQTDMQRAAEIGLIEIDGTEVVLRNASFAETGPAVAALGVSVSEMLDEYEALQHAVDGIATRFREVFERRLWSDYVADGMPAAGVSELTAAANHLARLATSTVTAELNTRFAEFVQEFIAEATDLTE